MSTNLECLFVKWNENEWYYALQNWDCPAHCWDWREYATAYGPFKSEEQANDHLTNNHANPGGACYERNPNKENEVLIELIEKAENSKKNSLFF